MIIKDLKEVLKKAGYKKLKELCSHEYDDFGDCEYCGKNRFVCVNDKKLRG